MGQVIRAPWGSGIDSIDQDHEHLHILINLAERSAVNGDRRHCGQMLQRAVTFLEQHAGNEEHLLTRSGYDRVMDVRRVHERLILSLEQALLSVERKDRMALIEEMRRIGGFLAESTKREAFSLRRFFAHPGNTPLAAPVPAMAAAAE